MAVTYKLISNTVLGSSQSSINISSIPSTYDDLSIFISARGTNTNAYLYPILMRMNGDSSSTAYNYNSTWGGYYSGGTNNQRGQLNSAAAGTDRIYVGYATTSYYESASYGNAHIYIPEYRSSDWKPVICDGGAQQGSVTLIESYAFWSAGVWKNTSSITSLQFTLFNGDSFTSGSSVKIYGINKT